MHRSRLTTLGVGGSCLAFCCATLAAGPSDRQLGRSVDAEQAITAFTGARSGALLDWEDGRISRVYGRAFSSGPSAFHSAKSFVDSHAEMFGVPAEDLVTAGPFQDGRHLQPIMYQKATGDYKFTGCYYTQVRDGVPVFRSRLNLLCRNDADFPLVLAAADLRDLGEFSPDPAKTVIDLGALAAVAQGEFGPDAIVTEAHPVIFAGVDGEDHAPTQAFETYVSIDEDRWLLMVEADTSQVIWREHRIFHYGAISGNVSGLVTDGPASAECDPEVPMPLPYLQVTSGLNSAYTDIDGNYTVNSGSPGIATVSASLVGEWFEVFEAIGADPIESVAVSPPGPGDMQFNTANTDERERAATNAYFETNVVRDYALSFNPSYPTLDLGGFPVNVNRTDGFCPANAWYSPSEVSLNFCLSSGGAPNTAWTSVVYHEYGHHLVEAAGSGQGQYGEGTGDVMSVLLLDDNRLGVGWGLNCSNWLRDADNTMQYPCSGEAHDCGQLISGCVWSVRNELVATNPGDYLEILGNLAVNSILMHTGSTITPQITIDYLTLDDDNDDILDGTPHYPQINAGFSAHNMPGPALALVSFGFPEGVPNVVAPSGNDTFPLAITAVTQSPASDSGMVHVASTPAGPYTPIAMNESSPNTYDVQLPPGDCGEQVYFFFTVGIEGGGFAVFPEGGSANPMSAVYATDAVQNFGDDFETDLGWTVADDGFLTDGTWDRGVPIGGGDRGDPPTDADGSGQCYLTDNVDGNSDVDGGATTLTSPVMDATGGTPYISYWRWYSNVEGSSAMDDTFVIEVNDGASGWVTLETVGPTGSEVSGGWYFKQFRIDDFVSLTDQFQIRFIASDTDPQSIVEAAVDGISLDAFSCTGEPCDADVTGDTVVDVNDLVAVVEAWGTTGPSAADVNGDLIVDVNDLVEVISTWGACP